MCTCDYQYGMVLDILCMNVGKIKVTEMNQGITPVSLAGKIFINKAELNFVTTSKIKINIELHAFKNQNQYLWGKGQLKLDHYFKTYSDFQQKFFSVQEILLENQHFAVKMTFNLFVDKTKADLDTYVKKYKENQKLVKLAKSKENLKRAQTLQKNKNLNKPEEVKNENKSVERKKRPYKVEEAAQQRKQQKFNNLFRPWDSDSSLLLASDIKQSQLKSNIKVNENEQDKSILTYKIKKQLKSEKKSVLFSMQKIEQNEVETKNQFKELKPINKQHPTIHIQHKKVLKDEKSEPSSQRNPFSSFSNAYLQPPSPSPRKFMNQQKYFEAYGSILQESNEQHTAESYIAPIASQTVQLISDGSQLSQYEKIKGVKQTYSQKIVKKFNQKVHNIVNVVVIILAIVLVILMISPSSKTEHQEIKRKHKITKEAKSSKKIKQLEERMKEYEL